jgi:hypothetical protein
MNTRNNHQNQSANRATRRKAHLLAAQLLAHNLEDIKFEDIQPALWILSIHRAIGSCAEHSYRDHKGVHASVPSKHPGWVAVVWSGRDCDNVAYSGQVRYVRADITSVMEEIDREYSNAEGPTNYIITKPSEAAGITYSSRDLALEAFEDGRSHVIYA